jgi:hypothetical protein
LARLQKRLPKGIHYLEALVSKNTGYEVVKGQMRLEFCEYQRDPSAIEQLQDRLLSDFAGIIKNHILILFDYNFSGVISVRAVLLTPQLDVAFDEDWSSYLKESYVIDKTSIIKEMISNDEESLVKLRPEKQKELADGLVSLIEESDVANK